MRLRLTLLPTHAEILPDTYRSAIQGFIYHGLGQADADYARMLHDRGYVVSEEKRLMLKMFCFSGLHDERGHHPRAANGQRGYALQSDRPLFLVIGSPKEEFIRHLLWGVFEELQQTRQTIHLNHCRFTITGLELLPPIHWEAQTLLRLTPFHSGFLAKARAEELQDGRQFLTLENRDRLEASLLTSLCLKFKQHLGQELPRASCHLKFCLPEELTEATIRSHTRRLAMTRNGQRQLLIVIHCALELSGPREWLEIAWDAGIGEKGSLGLGMVRLSSEEDR